MQAMQTLLASTLFLVLACVAVAQANADNNVWVVLAAGSDGWNNYRHQADLYHFYHVIRQYQIPEDHIITMFFDDIAFNEQNPTPGIVVNAPNGTDVYAGVQKDYIGDNVTVNNFLKVITGEPTNQGTGRVLGSNSNSHVFIFFDDHGNRDIIGFPDGHLDSAHLNKALWEMYQKQIYNSLVVYVSACYSGSMFYSVELPPNTYVATAAPILASAFATAYDALRQVYTSSTFPYAAIDSMEKSLDMTFQQHFEYINTQVANYSLPCQYGDVDFFGSITLAEWFRIPSSLRQKKQQQQKVSIADLTKDSVPQYEVPFELAKKHYLAKPSAQTRAELEKETMIRKAVDKLGDDIVKALLGNRAKDGVASVPPCQTCTSDCPCLSECTESVELCSFECCDSRACTYDHVPKADSILGSRMQAADKCADQVVGALQHACGFGHDYISSLEVPLTRLCRRSSPAIAAAIHVINAECPAILKLIN